MTSGFLTEYKCPKCGTRIKCTILEGKYVCPKCNIDYGYQWEEKEDKFCPKCKSSIKCNKDGKYVCSQCNTDYGYQWKKKKR